LVYGSVLSPLNALTDHCKEGMVVQTGLLHSHSFSVIDLPGHTLDHIGFYDSRHLFCGDTLFACGCGRIFEGSPETLHASLTKICSLDDTLAVCCAHEYTLSNLEFALHVDPENSELKNYADQLARKFEHTGTTLPVLLKDEKQFNPFLRCQDSAILNSVLRETPNFTPKNEIEVFAALREWKNRF
jgi:hydroxyacylglutathione hydrolase